ncbi:MAG TPA: cation:proton antiporter [Gemmatimonadaceae bacterium]|nr:cation:proton antiporter [Gemmatimonadaceae bacterium]
MREVVTATLWFIVAGLLLIGMAAASGWIARLPLTTAILYLGVGVLMGPLVGGVIGVEPVRHAAILERVTEIAVLVSLFGAGLKLRQRASDPRWQLPLRLATLSMGITVALVAVAGVLGLGLSVGAAVLLGAILAPTDPVLASDVQVAHPRDRDRLRFALTGEAALNDGAAFPFVMLGLGLLGLHELGPVGWRWLAVDVLWATVAGLATGWVMGWSTGRVVLWLRSERREAVGLDDLLALGLIALSYGVALLVHGYGFLAVFAAGYALRREERIASPTAARAELPPAEVLAAAGAGTRRELATSRETAPAYMARAALGFTEQLERILEVGVVLLLGGMLSRATVTADGWWFVPVLFLVIRPIAVLVAAPMRGAPSMQRYLAMWFGIRGVGSIYYLSFAIQHGAGGALGQRLAAIVFTTVAASILLHGISVTPLMRRYERGVEEAQGSGAEGRV